MWVGRRRGDPAARFDRPSVACTGITDKLWYCTLAGTVVLLALARPGRFGWREMT